MKFNRPIQSSFKNEWQILAASIVVAQTSQDAAMEIVPKLFKRWPTYLSMAKAQWIEVDRVLGSGVPDTLAEILVEMSSEYDNGGRPVRDLPGVGNYAFEAWRVFFAGDIGFEPKDPFLRAWIKHLREGKQ